MSAHCDDYERDFIAKARLFEPGELAAYEEFLYHLEKQAQPIGPRLLGLKLIVIADTHGYLAFGRHRFQAFMDTVANFDLCVLLGDLETYDMDRIMEIIPAEKIVGVLGNHDIPELYDMYGVRDINGRTYEHKGVTFAGLEGGFRYKKGQTPMYTQYESLMLAQTIRGQADILISHDRALTQTGCDPAHAGLIGNSCLIYKNNISLHLHGHVHKSYEACYSHGTRERSVYLCEYMEV